MQVLVQLPLQAGQLDELSKVRDTSWQRVLLEAAFTDVLLVRVVLRTPSRTGARAAARDKQGQEEEETDRGR